MRKSSHEVLNKVEEKGSNMSAIQEKMHQLEAAKRKVDVFLEQNGDLKSQAAVLVGLEFVHAFDAVAREFGYEVVRPLNGKSG